jgi:hypothetical protein
LSTLAFQLAGLTFQLSSAEAFSGTRLPAAYAGFLTEASPGTAHARYRILDPRADTLHPIEPSGLLWQSETWRLGPTGNNGRLGIELQRVADGSWIPVVNVAPDFSTGDIRPLYGRMVVPSACALNHPYDQTLLLNRLLYFGAGVVHACGIVERGQGLIFAGRSGAGKTTLARLWRSQGATLLNDDRVILRRSENGIRLDSSPWHGEDPQVNAVSIPLRAIVHLNQAPGNRLRRLDGTESLTAILATTVAPFYSESGMEKLLEAWTEVAEKVPSYRLDFTPDGRAVELCRREILSG